MTSPISVPRELLERLANIALLYADDLAHGSPFPTEADPAHAEHVLESHNTVMALLSAPSLPPSELARKAAEEIEELLAARMTASNIGEPRDDSTDVIASIITATCFPPLPDLVSKLNRRDGLIEMWGVLHNTPPLLVGQEWEDAFKATLEATCKMMAEPSFGKHSKP